MRNNPGMSLLCVVLIMLFSLTTLSPVSAEARSKRTTHKVVKKKHKSRRHRGSKCSLASRAEGKRQAMELVRTQSSDLCKLVGIQPASDAESRGVAQRLIEADGEETIQNVAFESWDEGEDLAELELEDDVTVDVESIRGLWLSYVDDKSASDVTDAGFEKQEYIDVIMDWLGTKYHFGGSARTGIDCSAFTRMVYETVAKVQLPRTASMQFEVGRVVRRNDLRFGDLVFFHTRRHARVSHVGMYLGDNLFAHASSRYGVTISSLESTYYSKRLLGGRRFGQNDIAKLATSSESGTN